MVKLCSPSVLVGVVDSSFKCTGRRAGDQDQTHQKNDVWPRRISLVASARLASFLASDQVEQASFLPWDSSKLPSLALFWPLPVSKTSQGV